jgi:outer membrane protein assembly factor BamA
MLSGLFKLAAQDKHRLILYDEGGKHLLPPDSIELKTVFSGDSASRHYLFSDFVPGLMKLGYLTVSVDSLQCNGNTTIAWVFLGQQYSWGKIEQDSIISALDQSGDMRKLLKPGVRLSPETFLMVKEQLLNQFEDAGYPFARFRFDSGFFAMNSWYAKIRVEPGPFYHIEKLINDGRLKIRQSFLEQYLGISSGDIFSKTKLESISGRLKKLGYLKESRAWDLSFLGTGATVNLHLDPEKSSRFNLLAGLMPSSQQLGGKLMLTGEADLELRNVFNAGESLLLRWQQIQVQSPRLQVYFEKPYLLKTPLGFDFRFNLLKKDSSFLTIDTRMGMVNEINRRSKVKLFLQQFSSVLINPDTIRVKSFKILPLFLDVRTTLFGIEMAHDALDDFEKNRKGGRWQFDLAGGLRRVIRNEDILSLEKDAAGNAFDFGVLYDTLKERTAQFKLKASAEKFWPIGKQGVLKTGILSGFILAKQVMLNEMFQIGGFKTLRGFDEESIFVSRYAVGTVEYRYLIGNSSYVYTFADLGYLEPAKSAGEWRGLHTGIGLGLTFETKAGQFSLAYAGGKREDQPFNFREAKIHFGIISLF